MPVDMINGFQVHANGSKWFAHAYGYGFSLYTHQHKLVCACKLP